VILNTFTILCCFGVINDDDEKKKKFYFAIQTTTDTHIASNHGRLPEKGVRPSKLATYCNYCNDYKTINNTDII